MELRMCDRFIYGLLFPIVLFVIGMLIIMNIESDASAAEFGALAVFFILIISFPIILIVNSVTILQDIQKKKSCFIRGMIVPSVVLIGAIVYQTGLWDKLT